MKKTILGIVSALITTCAIASPYSACNDVTPKQPGGKVICLSYIGDKNIKQNSVAELSGRTCNTVACIISNKEINLSQGAEYTINFSQDAQPTVEHFAIVSLNNGTVNNLCKLDLSSSQLYNPVTRFNYTISETATTVSCHLQNK